MNLAKRVFYKIKYTIHKLLHWEYWPQEVVYAIIYPYYAWMAFRLRAAGFFVVANPHDGEMNFLMESKIKIYKHIPVQYRGNNGNAQIFHRALHPYPYSATANCHRFYSPAVWRPIWPVPNIAPVNRANH